MKTLVTTLGTAGTIAFAALGLAAAASAAPAQSYAPTGNLTSAQAPFAQGNGNGADRNADQYRQCVERARIGGYTGIGLPVAGVESCSMGQLPALVGFGH